MKRAGKVLFYFAFFIAVTCTSFYAGSNAPAIMRRFGIESAQAGMSDDGGLGALDHKLLDEAYAIVQLRFLHKIDDKETEQKMEYGAIKGMLKSLDDQYTRFMDPKAYNNMNIETKGKFGGIGIVIGIRDEQLTVISPLEGTPATKAGLKSGDIILKINGEKTEDMALDDAVARIRGNPGEKVTLTIWRREFKSFDGKDYDIIRDVIELKPVNDSKMIEGTKIGYLKLESFSKVSKDEMKKTILDFKKQGMKAMILDLRNNPGGLLDAAVEVSNLFIDEGPIVHRENRDHKLLTYYAKPGNKIVDFPVVVLVNEYSASASEIVSGALQDHGVATIMGEKTFGKGLVQTVYTLSDDSAILVTTDRYLTANKRDINLKGIIPDIIVSKETVDTHNSEAPPAGGDAEAKPGTVGKFFASDLKGTNGVIFDGMPIKDIKYKNDGGKKYLEVDDVARMFGMSVQIDDATGILDMEKDPNAIKEKDEDIQLKRAIEFLKEKIGEPVDSKQIDAAISAGRKASEEQKAKIAAEKPASAQKKAQPANDKKTGQKKK